MSRRRVEHDQARDERGFTTVQYVATVGLSLVFLVLFANLLVDLYARGAVRDALDEGVRTAAPAGTRHAACAKHVRDEVLDGLLRGPLADDIRSVRTGRLDDGRARGRHACRRGCLLVDPVVGRVLRGARCEREP